MTKPEFSETHTSSGATQRRDNGPDHCARDRPAPEPGRSIPCFLAGTLIATKRGEVAVEDLRPADMVVVRDGGFAPIRWIGSVRLDARGAWQDCHAPICIPRGAMGRNMPARDLYVSPDHRIWMRDAAFETHFAQREVLIPARHLVGWKGIKQVSYVPEPLYFHLLFDRHQILLSDGMLTESLDPGRLDLDQFDHQARDEMRRLFPDLLGLAGDSATARKCLTEDEAPLALGPRSAA